MNGFNEEDGKKDKKGGFLGSLSNLFGKGSAASGGASGFGSAGSGLGSSFGLGGLFATKAGILGMVLGGATIAAGIGVVYNFLGPSSKAVYTPQLFQDTYYADQSQNASMERAKQKEEASAASSGLDMFRDQAKKDGIGMGADGAAAEKKDASADSAAAGDQVPNSGAAADSSANAPGGGVAKLQASAGFGSAKGGSGSASAPKLNGGGGMFGGIGGQFTPVYRPPAGQGKSSSMRGSMASAIKNSPKRALSDFNKKGAFGQAKFAKSQGLRASGSSSAADSRTSAAEAFSGETAGNGDVGSAGAGAGLGGSGVSSGGNLKNSDPSINSNDSTPPPAPAAPQNVSPWEKYTNMAMYAMLAAALLVFIAGVLADKAKKLAAAAVTPVQWAAAAAMYQYAMYACYAAIAAAAIVVFCGVMLMSKFGQKWTGIMYVAAGGMLIVKAYQALVEAQDGSAAAVNSGATASALQAGASTAPVGATGGSGTILEAGDATESMGDTKVS